MLDLAIGYFPDARHLSSSLIMETLTEENNVMIARRGHSMWKCKLTLKRFTQLNHAAVIYRNQPWGLIDNELAARGLRRRLKLALPHCLSVLHAVASSDLVACIQESVVKSFGGELDLRSCAEPLGLRTPFALRMVWHRQRNEDPASTLASTTHREQACNAVSQKFACSQVMGMEGEFRLARTGRCVRWGAIGLSSPEIA